MNINTVTVVGANGTMGANISGIFASFGSAKVYMVSRDMEKSKRAAEKAAKSVRAESVARNLIPADYSMLEKCVAESDLVFESAAENLSIKLDITRRIAAALRSDTVACTGTSGLAVTRLAECLPENLRSRYLGMHLFNPPYNMTLCEVIPTKYTDQQMLQQVCLYLKDTLYRTVVEVKDAPAFLAHRIGFQFINEAMQYAESYKHSGGIDYIDSILGTFTGRAMAPLTTADFVGLDVHKAIVDNLYSNTADYAHETFVLPKFAQDLIDQGKLGRKTGCGFYKMEIQSSGAKKLLVYDIATDSYRERRKYGFAFAEEMNQCLREGDYAEAFRKLIQNQSAEARLCLEFLLKYIIYSMRTVQEVAFDIHAADAVMATGFNWCPPLAMIDALSAVIDFGKLVEERLDRTFLEQTQITDMLAKIVPSHYDYRPYFKAAK